MIACVVFSFIILLPVEASAYKEPGQSEETTQDHEADTLDTEQDTDITEQDTHVTEPESRRGALGINTRVIHDTRDRDVTITSSIGYQVAPELFLTRKTDAQARIQAGYDKRLYQARAQSFVGGVRDSVVLDKATSVLFYNVSLEQTVGGEGRIDATNDPTSMERWVLTFICAIGLATSLGIVLGKKYAHAYTRMEKF